MCESQEDQSPAIRFESLAVSVYRTDSELGKLESIWNSVVDSSSYPNVFLRWEWIATWWKWFGAGKQLHILTLTDKSRVVGIVPWYLSSPTFLHQPTLLFLGANGPTCPEYLGPILDPKHAQAAVKTIIEHVGGSPLCHSALVFPDVPADDASTRSLADAFNRSYASVSRPGETCYYLRLPETIDDFYGTLRKHTRERKKRQLRRAREECNAVLEVLERPEETDAAFAVMHSLSASSRRRQGQITPFARKDYAGFHRDVIGHFSRSGIARIYILRFNDKPVAFLYGFIYKDKFYAFQTGFDFNLARYSPGDVIYQMIFQHLIGENAREFDCLRGAEEYKEWFATGARTTQTTWLFPDHGPRYQGRRCLEHIVRPLRSRTAKHLRKVQMRIRQITVRLSKNTPSISPTTTSD